MTLQKRMERPLSGTLSEKHLNFGILDFKSVNKDG